MYKTCHLELLNDELNIVKYFAFERLSNATCYKNLTMPTSVCCTLNCIHWEWQIYVSNKDFQNLLVFIWCECIEHFLYIQSTLLQRDTLATLFYYYVELKFRQPSYNAILLQRGFYSIAYGPFRTSYEWLY